MTEWRHVLSVPGGRPIEIEYRASTTCESCVTRLEDGDVVHHADCPAARSIVAQAARDITLDGAVELAEEARAVFAGDYADLVLEDDDRVAAMRAAGPGNSDEDLAPLRHEISIAYAAGFRQAEGALIAMSLAGARRIREEIDQLIASLRAWAPVDDEGDDEGREGNP